MARKIPQKIMDPYLVASTFFLSAVVFLNVSFPSLSEATEILSSAPNQQTQSSMIHFQNRLPRFIYLSYLNSETEKYHKGWDDLYFISFWVLVWLSLRELLMNIFWNPLGSFLGLKNAKKLQRFSEQGWTIVYCTAFWCMGIKILSGYPQPILALNIRQCWQGYPHTSLDALCKFYYLSQIAFWFQQIVVLQIEKRRKDYHQMFAHHIVTVVLVCGSYATNFTGLGMVVHTAMDLADILLALAKMLNYLQVGVIGDASFLVFVFSWIYTRHYVLIRIIFAIYNDLPEDIEFVWKPSEGHMASRSLWIAFLTLLSILEVLLMIWLFMILRVLWKVMRGQSPEDSRSDTESVISSQLFKELHAEKAPNFCRDTEDEVAEPKTTLSKLGASEKEPLLRNSRRFNSST